MATAPVLREVVVGRNSKVWRATVANPEVARRFPIALSHREIADFNFTSNDRVWVFAYSREAEANSRLIAVLQAAMVHEVVYVSSVATIATRVTRCYGYPRIKAQAEKEALSRLNARILVLGLYHRELDDLPRGRNMATSTAMLEGFLLRPDWSSRADRRVHLFAIVDRPHANVVEARLYHFYGRLISMLGRWPCALRPLDALLRLAGIRWYGYVYLSNRLWTTTTS